jgi:glycosyltransferase involved in cell wall biosynthesis
MTKFDVTVITVVRNAHDSIRLTLESVKAQSHVLIQHVVIDGQSTDGTLEIIQEYNVDVLISEPDHGTYDAMEKSRAFVKGRYCIFLNSGDVFADSKVCSDVLVFATKHKLDIVFGNLLPVYLRGIKSHNHAAFQAGKTLDLSYLTNRAQLYSESIHHQATFYSNKIIKRASFVCEENLAATGEYHLLLQAFFDFEAKVGHIPLTISRFALGGISTKDFEKEWPKFNMARDILRSKYFPNGIENLIYDEFEFLRYANQKIRSKVKLRIQIKKLLKSSLLYTVYNGIMFRLQCRIINALSQSLSNFESNFHEQSKLFIRNQEKNELLFSELSGKLTQIENATRNDRLDNSISSVKDLLEGRISNLSLETQKLSRLVLSLQNSLDGVKSLVASGAYAKETPKEFKDAGRKVFSQFNEDGLIEFLVGGFVNSSKYFVEIGCGDYKEANTRLLMETQYWQGLIIDGSIENIDRILNSDWYWRYPIKAICGFITRENVVDVVTENSVNQEIDLLSIDIDGMDYWIWEALSSVHPKVVVIEYNALFGPEKHVSVPYDLNFDRYAHSSSGLYAGASFSAILSLGHKKGYVLVGTNSGGNNMFFMLKEEASRRGILEDTTFKKATFRESRNEAGELTYLEKNDGLKEIAHLSVFSFHHNDLRKIDELFDL